MSLQVEMGPVQGRGFVLVATISGAAIADPTDSNVTAVSAVGAQSYPAANGSTVCVTVSPVDAVQLSSNRTFSVDLRGPHIVRGCIGIFCYLAMGGARYRGNIPCNQPLLFILITTKYKAVTSTDGTIACMLSTIKFNILVNAINIIIINCN